MVGLYQNNCSNGKPRHSTEKRSYSGHPDVDFNDFCVKGKLRKLAFIGSLRLYIWILIAWDAKKTVQEYRRDCTIRCAEKPS
jgi:hypothetical protein